MSDLLAAQFTAWLAAAGVASVLTVVVASVARLLPARYARAEALLWVAVGLVGMAAAWAVCGSACAWRTNLLAYTPHLERSLPHLCFLRAGQSWLGAELLRGLSLLTAFLWLAGLAVLVGGGCAARRASAQAASGLTHDTPFGARLRLVAGQGPLARVVGLWRPRVLVSAPLFRPLPRDVQAAVVIHELSHARWRDPLVRLLLAAFAVAVPVPGQFVLRRWAEASELAADGCAVRRAGQAAWRQAVQACAPNPQADLRAMSLAAPHRPQKAAAALAALAAWAVGLATGVSLYARPAALSLVCAFEAVRAAWH
jgi:Zn-dependent protease with chaperone function